MKFSKTKIIWCVSSIVLAVALSISFVRNTQETITTCWGESFRLPDEIKQVIKTHAVQRLKKIDQSGPSRYYGLVCPKFSRYEHSVDVWALLAKNNATLAEQIVGLLHDVSHTVFSHVGDFLFAKTNALEFVEKSYQDTVHIQYLKSEGIDDIVRPFNLDSKKLDPDCGKYLLLEQSIPDMCADRIQYNIKTGLMFKIISIEDARKIVNDLSFKDGKWFFTDKNLAKKFAELSLYFTQNFWGAKSTVMQNIYMAAALKRAIALGIIKKENLTSSTDDEMLKALNNSQDKEIQQYLKQCASPLETISNIPYKKEMFHPKFRGIDPLVLVDEKLVRLTTLDLMFANYYLAVKKWCSAGFEIEILQ